MSNIRHIQPDNGIIIGIPMTLTALAIIWTTHCVWAAALAVICAVIVPIALYRCSARQLSRCTRLPHPAVAIMQSFTTIFCGSIILGLVLYLYLNFAEPTWIADTMQRLADIYAGSQFSQHITTLLARGHIPTAIEASMVTILLAMFTGCSVSVLLTPLAMRARAKQLAQNDKNN